MRSSALSVQTATFFSYLREGVYHIPTHSHALVPIQLSGHYPANKLSMPKESMPHQHKDHNDHRRLQLSPARRPYHFAYLGAGLLSIAQKQPPSCVVDAIKPRNGSTTKGNHSIKQRLVGVITIAKHPHSDQATTTTTSADQGSLLQPHCIHLPFSVPNSRPPLKMAGQEGIEPPTCGFGIRCSAN